VSGDSLGSFIMTSERENGAEHHHDHEHRHPPLQPDDTSKPGRAELAVLALKELLIEKGILTRDQIRRGLETLDSWLPARGAAVVARAWTDPAYKVRLLTDGSKAVAELGIDVGDTRLVAVENTECEHNVVVCTLCSCYPRALLGLPPDWYRSKNYRARVVVEPRKVLAEFGTIIPEDVAVRVHDSLADLRYLVLPRRPAGTEGWTEAQLAAIVTRDCMVGVTLPKVAG
jgi:nitrile hydratase